MTLYMLEFYTQCLLVNRFVIRRVILQVKLPVTNNELFRNTDLNPREPLQSVILSYAYVYLSLLKLIKYWEFLKGLVSGCLNP